MVKPLGDEPAQCLDQLVCAVLAHRDTPQSQPDFELVAIAKEYEVVFGDLASEAFPALVDEADQPRDRLPGQRKSHLVAVWPSCNQNEHCKACTRPI